MKTKEMLEMLSKCFSDFKCHSSFLAEFKQILQKEVVGKEKQLFKQLLTQLSNIKSMGRMVYMADKNERLKGTSKNFISIHLASSQYNVRLLIYVAAEGEAYFLSAFYERAGKSRTDYSRHTSVLDERLEQLLGRRKNEP